VAGALEQSNVDLSREFVDLIAYQRGFQASSRIIQTADDLYGELVNLKR
jgi:flagellar hook protein FlgE